MRQKHCNIQQGAELIVSELAVSSKPEKQVFIAHIKILKAVHFRTGLMIPQSGGN